MPRFDITPPPAAVRKPESGKRFVAQSIRRVLCAAGAHTAGLILSGDDHLVWRDHQVHAGSSAWKCSASGKDLCDAPAPEVKGVLTPLCERPAGRGWVA